MFTELHVRGVARQNQPTIKCLKIILHMELELQCVTIKCVCNIGWENESPPTEQ